MTLPDKVFTVRRQMRFSHSDPAGIVFYPEFFRMFNDLFEDWIIKCLRVDFARQFLIEQRMFPLMSVSVDFREPRKIGDFLDLTLLLTELGRSSIRYDIIGHDGDLEILRGSFVNCIASKLTMRSIEIPPELRIPMEAYRQVCSN